ncbi:hypothetical protein, partial [Stenotrophomonas maltophilia]|uniref:hypothetical protein n=1 Tax=Stenotrophomonas maltophilia TaxID=40324 RepID=UPI001954FB47
MPIVAPIGLARFQRYWIFKYGEFGNFDTGQAARTRIRAEASVPSPGPDRRSPRWGSPCAYRFWSHWRQSC